MKTLKDLLKDTPVTALHGDGSTTVAALAYDSRAVTRSDCFFATRGTQSDGHDFIPDAVAKAPRPSSASSCLPKRPTGWPTSSSPTPQERWPTWPQPSTATRAAN